MKLSTPLLTLLFLACATAFATDHNEPDLLNSFYRDRDGSGADIYHIFAYPNQTGDKLNLVLTLAPLPETGKFDPESVQRIYLCPAVRPVLDLRDEGQMIDSMRLNLGFLKTLNNYRRDVIKPIVKAAGQMFIEDFNNLPIDQKHCPEIMASYSNDGMKAKVTFKNFHFDGAKGWQNVIIESNGKETEVDRSKIKSFQGIDIFVGGRDDAFYVDLGGFFRSMNWSSALDENREFIWEGNISYLDSPEKKESFNRAKRLLDREKKEIVYNRADSRAGNNINALSFSIPYARLTDDVKKNRILRVWAESFLTESAYNKIAPKQEQQ